MTAYAVFQNPTEWSFQKWKEEVNWKIEKMSNVELIDKNQVIYSNVDIYLWKYNHNHNVLKVNISSIKHYVCEYLTFNVCSIF